MHKQEIELVQNFSTITILYYFQMYSCSNRDDPEEWKIILPSTHLEDEFREEKPSEEGRVGHQNQTPGRDHFITEFGGGSGRGAPLRSKMFSISCSFRENLAKSYVGTPPDGWHPLLRGILDPPLEFSSADTEI